MKWAAALGAVLAAVLAIGWWAQDDEPAAPPTATDAQPADPADLVGRWRGAQPGVRLAYVFRPNGTYTHRLETRQERRSGFATFTIDARGAYTVRGATVRLRPRRGTKRRRDPDDPKGDYTRPLERFPQTYNWSIRGEGEDARLVMSIGGGLAVRFKHE